MSTGKFHLGYVSALDGIRGLAIILVMLYHLGELCFLPGLVEGGHIGVDIFFVLSGFLITSIIIREFDTTGHLNFKHFYLRRFLRLGPALLSLLIVLAISCYFLLDEFWCRYNITDTLIALFYMSNWARAFRVHSPAFLGHTWSLSIEEQFYIIWPLILFLVLKYLRSRWMIALVALLIAVSAFLARLYLLYDGAAIERLYNGLDTRADSLLTGCSLGVILSSRLIDDVTLNALSKITLYLSPVCLSFLLIISTSLTWRSYHLYGWGLISVAVSTAILIFDVVINDKSVLRPVFSMRWLVWIGKVSYGLYLWHYPIYKMMIKLQFDKLQVMVFGNLITFLLVVMSYYLLEQPLLRYKRASPAKG